VTELEQVGFDSGAGLLEEPYIRLFFLGTISFLYTTKTIESS
jgi:hypothetical protein